MTALDVDPLAPRRSRKEKWIERLILLGLAGKALLSSAPKPTSTQQRLAMLPLKDAPVERAVRVLWNRQQVPAIFAQSDEDLFTTVGMVHGHLRLAQLELARRCATGTFAEVIGPIAVGFDYTLRLMGFTKASQSILEGLPEETRRLIDAFLAGINHILAHGPVPHEFKVLGLRPKPWTIEDFLAVQRLCGLDMSWSIWSFLMPLREKMPPTAWQDLWHRLLQVSDVPDFRDTQAYSDFTLPLARHGSNSWALGASKTGGAGIIASDPHLPFSVPAPVINVRLASPGFDCVGLMMPGQPFIALGRNQHIAWGGTSLHAQSSDLFDVGEEPGSRFHSKEELFKTRWRGNLKLCLREHEVGPLVSDGLQLKARQRLAMAWMGHGHSDEITAMLGVMRAKNWDGFRTALKDFGVSGLNMTYTDVAGNVGRLCAVHMPDRPQQRPSDMILPLSEYKAWSRRLDCSELPSEYNPPEGYIVSANARPTGETVPTGFFFAPRWRELRIQQLCAESRQVNADGVKAMQADVYSPWGLATLGWLLPRLPAPADESQRNLLEVLRTWDGHYRPKSRGAVALACIIHVLVERFGQHPEIDAYDKVWGREQHLDSIVRPAFEAADQGVLAELLAAAADLFPKDVTWRDWHAIHLAHPLARFPGVGKRFATVIAAGEGSNDTVSKSSNSFADKATPSYYGSSARHVSDLSDPDANWFALRTGQDGWVGSENWGDQNRLWERGDYVQVPMTTAAIEGEFIYETIFEPAKSPS